MASNVQIRPQMYRIHCLSQSESCNFLKFLTFDSNSTSDMIHIRCAKNSPMLAQVCGVTRLRWLNVFDTKIVGNCLNVI